MRRPVIPALVLLLLAAVPLAKADVRVSTDQLRLVFNDEGSLLSARSCIPDCSAPNARSLLLESKNPVVRLIAAATPVMQLQRTESAEAIHLKFFSTQGGAEYSWLIPRTGWSLQLDATGLTSLQAEPGTGFAGAPANGFGRLLERVRYVTIKEKAVTNTLPDKPAAEPIANPDWLGVRNRFWTLLLKPANDIHYENRHGTQPQLAGILIESVETAPLRFTLYIGPVEPSALRATAPALQHLMYSGLWTPLRWICQLLYHLFSSIHRIIPNWPLAIMLLSLSVSILMRPLSRIAERLQEDVNEKQALLEPHLRQIRRTSRGEKQAERILALYKSEGIHPLYALKSLVGVMVVIPVFIGAFDMLAENIWLSGQSFLWVQDLSLPDSVASLPFSLPFLGDQLNVLPWLMTGLSVYASWLHQPTGHDREMHRSRNLKLLLMALAFFILFYTFPAGMVLYWTTNNLISVLKALFQKYAGLRQTDAG